MKQRRDLVLKAFLSRSSQEAELISFLPEEEQHTLKNLPEYGPSEEISSDDLLEFVHWSWFLPTLKSHSEKEQSLFLSALGMIAAKNIGHELHIAPPKHPVSESGRAFLRQILLHSLIGTDEGLIPAEYLPPSPLNALLKMDKKEMKFLIDWLSLHDLSYELRQIVETKILKKIYSLLSEEEKAFLKSMANQKEPYPIPRIGLDRWDGTEEALRLSLHRRGLARLGAALSGQDPDLIWYVCHQLDIGRGTALYKQCANEPLAGISEWVIRQIQELLTKSVNE